MKQALCISPALMMVLFFQTLSAQIVPSIEWQKCFGGSDYDEAFSVQNTVDGGFIAAGDSAGDYWIIKLNSAGDLMWEKSYGGSGGDFAYYIHQTTDKGYIVAGSSSSNDGDVTGNHPDNLGYPSIDYWILRLDSVGNLIWEKSFGGKKDDAAKCVRQTNDGGFIVTGSAHSNNGDVSGNHGNGNYDIWVVKLDTNGNLAWQKCFGGSGYEESNSIQQTSDGGFIIAGGAASMDGDVSGNHDPDVEDYWIVKLDSVGNLMWQKCLGGTETDVAFDIQLTDDGSFVIAGISASGDGDVTGHHESGQFIKYDEWVVRVDANQNIVWEKSLGGSDFDYARSICQTMDGGFVIAGDTWSVDGDVTGNNNGDINYWILKLDTDGSLLWQKCMGGSEYDWGYSVRQTPDSGYMVAGTSRSNDGDVSGNHGMGDFWIVKLSRDVATGVAPLPEESFSFYPNPDRSQLTINLPTSSNEAMIAVYDVQGKMTSLPVSYQSDKARLNTADLPEGFYILQITDKKSGKIEVGKFVKQD